MSTYIMAYMPVLKACGVLFAAWAIYKMLTGGGIDPGPPNAKAVTAFHGFLFGFILVSFL